MEPEVKQRWLEALRSGKYPKGKSYLCNDGQYCCLGVLAEIENLLEGKGLKSLSGYVSILPKEVSEKYDLHIRDNMDQKYSRQMMLATLNDQSDTFDAVIEYIEKNL